VTSAENADWGALVAKCHALGLCGDELYDEILRTATKPRVKGPLPPLPPVRRGPPAEEVHYPLSEPEFVRQPTADGGSEVWQIVRYDEPDVDLMPAKIYLNGFRLLWTDSGMPAELPDGTPVPPDIEDVIILDGPTVFGDVLICLTGQPYQTAWIRHDQLLIKPRDVGSSGAAMCER
jgi:hypothetical protein